MGISRDSLHKRRATGGKQTPWKKKRKFELGRQPASTRIGPKRIHDVRVRGGHIKKRALRLESGVFSWASQAIARKTRITNVVYNATSNELVRTNTLVKSAIVQIDAAPLRQWYEAQHGVSLGRKKDEHGKLESQADIKLDQHLIDEFVTGKIYAKISSRPGQCGRADGYILEGKELDFYIKKLKSRKGR